MEPKGSRQAIAPVSVPPLLSGATCSCLSPFFRAESLSPLLARWLPLLDHGLGALLKL